jgi:hypothetical protein
MDEFAESVRGDIPRALHALRGLVERVTRVDLKDGRSLLCGGALRVRDRTIIGEIGEADWDEYRIAVSNFPEIVAPWSFKQTLWKLVLDRNGPQFAESHVWGQFNLRPTDPFWQRTLASYMGFFVKYHTLAATGHPFIDHGLSVVCACIGALPMASRREVWEILDKPVWVLETIPDTWTSMETKMGSHKHVFAAGSTVPAISGALALQRPFEPVKEYHGYPPSERNRIALLSLFIHSARVARAMQAATTTTAPPPATPHDGGACTTITPHTDDAGAVQRDMIAAREWDHVPNILRQLAVALALAESRPALEGRAEDRRRRSLARARAAEAARDRQFWGTCQDHLHQVRGPRSSPSPESDHPTDEHG